MTAPPTFRIILGVMLLSLSTACLPGFVSRGAPAPAPTMDPMAFFAGRTKGDGTLGVRFGATKTLRVEGAGHMQADGTFRLDQQVTYGDNTVETRFWILRRVDASRYTATLSDAKGDVSAEVVGNPFHLRYLVRQPAVYVEQWLYLQPDGRSVDNRMQVTVLGVPWARLSETITREAGGA